MAALKSAGAPISDYAAAAIKARRGERQASFSHKSEFVPGLPLLSE